MGRVLASPSTGRHSTSHEGSNKKYGDFLKESETSVKRLELGSQTEIIE